MISASFSLTWNLLKPVAVNSMTECDAGKLPGNGDEDVMDYVGDLKAWNARAEVLKFEGWILQPPKSASEWR